MEATVLTLNFDPEKKTFPREELEDFCMNKNVHSFDVQFFQRDREAYWTVFIQFERLIPNTKGLPDLTPPEKKLYDQLKVWRKEKAETEGYPAYLVATNRHLIQIIKKRVRSHAGFDGIKGFGRKRIAKYGNDIIIIIGKFFNNEQK